MNYCTLDDLLTKMPEDDVVQLTDDAGTGAVDTAATDRAIGDASEIIDSYLRGRYSLPIDPVPDVLNTLASDIARYRLYSRRVRILPPDMVIEAYKDAISRLKDIEAGRMVLGAGAPDAESVSVSRDVRFEQQERLFSRDRMGGF